MDHPANPGASKPVWCEIHDQLEALSKCLAELDYDIGYWLLRAARHGVYRELGKATLAEYAEQMFGFEPHKTRERLRVAEALEVLPAMCAALREGRIAWSAARELTRVASPQTETAWLADVEGCNVRDIEKKVSGLPPGALPGEKKDPRRVRKTLHIEVGPEGLAAWREAVSRLRKEIDPALSEQEVLAEMCRRSLGAGSDEGRAPYQVALLRCPDCDRSWREAGGDSIEVAPETLERALCDAQHLGDVGSAGGSGTARAAGGETSSTARDAEVPDRASGAEAAEEPGASHVGHRRARQSIPPAVRRQVMRRDHGRCRVPGCTNHRWVEVHHVRLRSEGGGHDPDNLLVLCGAHHDRLHAGYLYIERSPDGTLSFFHADGSPYGAAPMPQDVGTFTEAYSILRNLGFAETEAKQGLAAVRARFQGVGADVTAIVRAVLHLRQAAGAGAARGGHAGAGA